ncbi:hypothetical protein [Mycetocola spongiae]|uniref:hypothetical protein n=1 Tax=Mycetocola spongiae TaxID=2859226 RepID=UPI001CF457CB|nr:hypothetical protein [Mycetocola spongiae]UCR90370.1 hypothetical protein KXZ72_06915 [Mycetocola spongiae]
MNNNFSEAIERMRAATEDVRAQTAAFEKQSQAERGDYDAAMKEIARARRAGEHGQDWRVLQQRIDVFQTTESDIMNGLDLSPEARAVRELLGKNLGVLRQQQLDAGPDEDQMLAAQKLQEVQARLLKTIQDLRQP